MTMPIESIGTAAPLLMLTNHPLVANGVFTSPWYDRKQTVWVEQVRVLAESDQAGSFVIQESVSLTGDVSPHTNALGTVSVSANAYNDTGYVALTSGYNAFRVVYTVGAAAQTQFTLEMGAASPDIIPPGGTLAAGENHAGEVGGNLATLAASFTRPANTTAYAALSAVSNSTSAPTVLTFTGCGRKTGGSGYVVGALLRTDQSACTSAFKLHLFNVAPTAIDDGSAYTSLWANNSKYLGTLTLPAMSTEGSGSTAATSLDFSDRLPFVCAAGDTNLYGLLETVGGFTPASGQNFYAALAADRN